VKNTNKGEMVLSLSWEDIICSEMVLFLSWEGIICFLGMLFWGEKKEFC